ncbi:MAG TPA: family 10 glycosylhydrolase [Candidatus Omnitrophota bacterium]|nr:family 10 glycosylhydrolase [Candidatus Omnitrophota bacterium]HPT38643.1 family 10 glycosylhydrolase [Candidatus Omnitrophota bacterium]
MKAKILIIFIFCYFFNLGPAAAENNQDPASQEVTARGIWVSVFSSKKILYSQQGVHNLITQCNKAKINEIYLQIFQSGNAYFDSKICDRTKYNQMVASAGIDPLDLLLREAAQNNIKVFAWVNVLGLGKNEKADILNKYGNSILTLDQYQRPAKISSSTELDKYYLREDLIFLEPGDPKVESYMLTIINEIINRYPLFSGIHLDYLRYPSPVPFVPGSRFNKFGLTYGYGPANVERFREKTGINVLDTLNNEDEYLTWDNWKRQQVTELTRKISSLIKVKSPALLVSCAVIPVVERAYSNAFQDWSAWLEEGIIDYVVLMSYTKDNQFIKETVKSSLGHRGGKGKIYVGIGAFLMKENPDLFFNQFCLINGLAPDGIVLYSIDDLTDQIIGYLN